MSTILHALGQCTNIPTPTLTERNLPSQEGKVFIVTGANAGVGFELIKLLYGADATVYAAGRAEFKVRDAIEVIKTTLPNSKGRLEPLQLDLANLESIKPAADTFLARETRLDALWNNAGVMMPPPKSKSMQMHELQMGTNCLGPYLFTTLLKDILTKTAGTSPTNSVRVAWAGSLAIDTMTSTGGVVMDEATNKPKEFGNPGKDYGQSKAGNLFLSKIFAKETEGSGIVSTCFNPGNLRTELQRHVKTSAISTMLVNAVGKLILYPAVYGAYTELYCGLAEEVTTADNGTYVAPWGRKSSVRADIVANLNEAFEGEPGTLAKFTDYCHRETREFM